MLRLFRILMIALASLLVSCAHEPKEIPPAVKADKEIKANADRALCKESGHALATPVTDERPLRILDSLTAPYRRLIPKGGLLLCSDDDNATKDARVSFPKRGNDEGTIVIWLGRTFLRTANERVTRFAIAHEFAHPLFGLRCLERDVHYHAICEHFVDRIAIQMVDADDAFLTLTTLRNEMVRAKMPRRHIAAMDERIRLLRQHGAD